MSTEYIDMNETQKEFEKVSGKKNLEGSPMLQDESFEALITDPTLILKDFRGLCEKHSIDFVGLLNQMGFNSSTFKALLVNKPITEQIYVLSRELNLVIYRLGVASSVSTLDARSMLGNTGNSKDWLEMLDTIIFPYIAEYDKNGMLDPDWFLKNNVTTLEEELAGVVQETLQTQTALIEEAQKADEAVADLLDATLVEEIVELSHGDDTVAEVAVKDAQNALEDALAVNEGIDIKNEEIESEAILDPIEAIHDSEDKSE